MAAGPNTIGIQGSVGNTITDPGIYYHKKYEETLKPLLVFEDIGEARNLPKNSGVQMTFERPNKITAVGTIPDPSSYLLTENTNGSSVKMTTTQFSVQPLTYGFWSQVSSELEWKSINDVMTAFTEEQALDAAAVVDSIIRTALSGNGTNQFVGQTQESDVTSSNVLTPGQIRKAVAGLLNRGIPGFEGNLYKGVIHPSSEYDLWTDTASVGSLTSIQAYQNADKIMRGEIGTAFGVRWVRGTNVGRGTGSGGESTTHTYIFGRKAFGISKLAGEGMKTIRKRPGPNDTSNPLDMFSTVGWKAVLAAVALEAGRYTQIYSGTAGD